MNSTLLCTLYGKVPTGACNALQTKREIKAE